MDYMSILTDKPLDREAIIINGVPVTYGGLISGAQEIRNSLPYTDRRRLYVIRENGILKQLLYFFACQTTKYIPLILPSDSRLSADDKIFDTEIPDSAVMAVMTSGTTGIPKILFRNYRSWGDFFPIQNKIFGIGPDSRMFVQGSLCFTGNLNLYMGHFYAGGTLVAEDEFLPKKWEKIILNNNVNTVYLIPSKLLLLKRVCSGINGRVRHIISGSQSLGRSDAEALKEIFPNAELTLYYGASELNYITYVKDSDMTEDRSLIGKPFPNVNVFIMDDELYVDTPYHVEGINTPYSLLDSGRMDENGNFYFLGRKDDIVNIRGRKVSVLKVENALEELDGVDEAAVLAVPRDGDKNDMVINAFIKTSDSYVSAADVKRRLAARLSAFEIPKRITVVCHIPKNSSGKTDKRALGDMIRKENFK